MIRKEVTISRCRWVYDQDVPDGRFLVPGCWNRATRGDDADCHCIGGEMTVHEEVQLLRAECAALRAHISPPPEKPVQEVLF